MKHSFLDDYSEGAHPDILAYLVETNSGEQMGYGNDEYSKLAVKRIQKTFQTKADTHFLTGGTQTNLICLSSMLKPYEAVIAVHSSHISIHEAGAIEATGHKIISVDGVAGKITPEEIKSVVSAHGDEHMVSPKVVFISQATELGTIYSKSELKKIAATAHKLGLYVYLDGARLASALNAQDKDLSPADLTKIGIDMFYIGGTKNGALCGEAVVIVNPHLQQGFRYYIKQHGGLLAKGRLLGAQFARFFDNDQLWMKLGKQSNDNAQYFTKKLQSAGAKFTEKPITNQLFIELPNKTISKLKKLHDFYVWKSLDANNSQIRLVTSWATDHGAIDKFVEDLRKL